MGLTPDLPRGGVPDAARPPRTGTVIDCDECAMQCTSTCDDCVVTFVLRGDDTADEPLTLDADEERVVRMLVQAGLVPALQYKVAV